MARFCGFRDHRVDGASGTSWPRKRIASFASPHPRPVKRLDYPVLDGEVRKSFKIPIGRQDDELMLSRQGSEHHVHLRQDAALSAISRWTAP